MDFWKQPKYRLLFQKADTKNIKIITNRSTKIGNIFYLPGLAGVCLCHEDESVVFLHWG
jgi:hypothetical protein